MMENRGTAKAARAFLVDGWPTPAPETCEECGRTLTLVLARALTQFGLDANAAPLLRPGRNMEAVR
jgi:hypothetical protein